jgi:Holliday junction resolvase
MSGRSRVKGARTERSIVASGIAAVRMPLSGAAGGRFAGDIVLPLMGRDLCVEVRAPGRWVPRAISLAQPTRPADREG